MSGYIEVKNFEKFQHYKNRNPIWIKLYNELLDDYEFGRLPDASKLHLVGIWLLASRHENRLPADPEWIGRRINATEPVNLDALASAGFIRVCGDASKLLAEPEQVASLEREGEKKREETPPTPSRAEPKASKKAKADPPGFDEFWIRYPKRAGSNPKAKAVKAYRARIKAGVDPGEILEGVKRYHRFCEVTGKLATEYVMQAATFVGPDERWLEAWTPPADTKPSPGSQAATVGEAASHANRPRPTTASQPSRPGEDPEAEERKRREEVERADAWGRAHKEEADELLREIQEEAGARFAGLPKETARAAILGEWRRRVLDEVLRPKVDAA